ncbi:hypothetical protein V2S84_13555, partial [Azotobacter chroococcum]|nr:hypothetical protein [Azotobacter chroococcum]
IDDTKSVDAILIKNKELLKRLMANVYANRKTPWRVTPGFICKLALISNFPDLFTESRLIEKGFDKDIAKIILSSADMVNNGAVLSTEAGNRQPA